MRNLFLALSIWLSLCCAVSGDAWGQGVPNGGAPMTPNAAPFIGFGSLGRSGTAASVTGTLTETPLATIPTPPIGANGQLRVIAYWTFPNSANTKTLRVRFGASGISGTAVATIAMTTYTAALSTTNIYNANATNSQTSITDAPRGSDGLMTTGFATTSVIDTTSAQNIVLTGQLASTGETITLAGYSIEYIN